MASEHFETNPFSPKEISNGLYGAESVTADGEKIALYMESITEENISKWRNFRESAVLIAVNLSKDTPRDSAKLQALAEIPRAVYAKSLSLGDYIVYAAKPGIKSPLLEQDNTNILMSVVADCTPRETMGGYILNEKSYSNRGIFRNPLSIIDGKYKGLAMLLHGFSAAVALKFFKDKSFLEVSPIASMQQIVYQSLPREAFAMTDEHYEIIKKAAQSKQGPEVITNWIKIEALSKLYMETSTVNAQKAHLHTVSPQEKTHSYKKSLENNKNERDEDRDETNHKKFS